MAGDPLKTDVVVISVVEIMPFTREGGGIMLGWWCKYRPRV